NCRRRRHPPPCGRPRQLAICWLVVPRDTPGGARPPDRDRARLGARPVLPHFLTDHRLRGLLAISSCRSCPPTGGGNRLTETRTRNGPRSRFCHHPAHPADPEQWTAR